MKRLNILKSIMLTLVFGSCNGILLAQEKTNYLESAIFYTTFESGVGEEIKMKFNVDSTDIVKIKESKLFKNWDSTTFSNPKNDKYIQRWKSLSHIEMFLMSITRAADFYTKFELKNQYSYTPISGKSYIYSDGSKITVVFPMKAQNGYGNFILSQAFYVIEWIDGKEKKFNFITID